MSAKSIFIITTSIFGSAFLGIFLSTIIFDGPDPDSQESFEKSTISDTKTIIESSKKEKPQVQDSEPTKPISEPSNENKPEVQDSESTKTVSESSNELEGTIISSSSTGVQ